MIAILSLISGFVSPWIGDVFKLFTQRQENKHELAMLMESNKSAREIAHLDAQVGMADAEVRDVQSARATQVSYGAKLLDAVSSDDTIINRYFIKPMLVFALSTIEVANGFMRPYAIYIIISMWASTKAARFYIAYNSYNSVGSDWVQVAPALAKAALEVWDEHDYAALDYVLGFLLGSRHKLKEASA